MATKNKLSQKGLEKIFGNVNNLVDEIEKNDEFKKEYSFKIELSRIKSNPYQPRKFFDDVELKKLANSINVHGVIQPILVKQTINNEYYLIAGERRLKASKIANLTKIPAIVLDIDDKKMHELALIENIQRIDLNPIEEASAYEKFLITHKVTQEKLALQIGKSRSHISNSVRLLKLPKNVKTYLLENKLSFGHAKILLAIKEDKKIEKLANLILEKKLSVRDVELYVSKLNSNNHNNTKIKKNNGNHIKNKTINFYLENKIMEKLGTKVKIKNTKIEISYTNVKDLNRILKLLNLKDIN